MLNGYLIRTALTSLTLFAALLATAPAPARKPSSCSDIRRLYAPRVLRELRAQLLLAYARARREAPGTSALRDEIIAASQESDDPRMKHLLAYVATKCL